MKHKNDVLRDLEYIMGGVVTLEKLTKEKPDSGWYTVFTEWRNTLASIIDDIIDEED